MASSPRTVIYCSNCGTPNPVGSKFCSNCGSAITLSPNSTPLPPIQVQVVTQPPVNDSSRRRRYLFLWFPLGAILMVLMCGLSYWSTLILIPPPTNDSPVADIQRMLFVGQHNIEHPEWIQDRKSVV